MEPEHLSPSVPSDTAPASAREHLTRILAMVGDGINILSGDYVLEYQNEVLIQQFGDQRGNKCYKAYAKRDEPCESCAMLRAIQTGAVQRAEMTGPDGQVYEISSSPFVDVDGRTKVIQVVRDVTESRRTAHALRESEELFRTLVESCHDVFFIYDADGTFHYVSPNCADLFGITIPAGAYRWREFLTDNPVNRRAVALAEEAMRTGQKPPPCEIEIRSPDGRIFWIEVTAAPQIRNGQAVGMIGAVHDITDRKLGEQQLRESEERYRMLIEKSPVAICIVQDGRFAYVNPKGCEMIGYSAEELIGLETWTVVHPDDREIVREQTFRRQLGEELPTHYEFRMVTKKGETRWVEIGAVPFLHGPRPAVIIHVMDITDRKRAEQGLRAAEARYRDLYENATDIIFTHDLDGHFTSVNAATERVFGWPREALVGRNIRDLIHPDSLAVMQRALEEKLLHPHRPSRPFELQMFDAKRETHWLEINSRLIFGQGEPLGVTGIARDITERKHLEAQLRQAQKMEALGKLAGGVAHDFNNLLTGILGYTRLLAERPDADATTRDSLAQIERAAQRAATLTRQLLAFSRHQQLSSVYLDLNRVVGDIGKLLSRTVGEDIEIRTELAPVLPAVYADRIQMEQVLLNLAVNARDAMPDGGQLTIATAQVEFDAPFVVAHPWARRGRFVQIVVADTGIGMDRLTRERAFEPFFSTKPPDKGTGLGLAIVYGIMQQHEGLIDLESEVGRGTTFHLYFPAAEAPAETGIEPPVVSPQGGHEIILLAEDEPIVRELATHILTEAGYRVVAVSDGEQALEALHECAEQFQLVILDMVMPRKGGAEIWKDVRAMAPGARILLTSGYAPESFDARMDDPAGPSFLPKPFTPLDLMHKVREILDATR